MNTLASLALRLLLAACLVLAVGSMARAAVPHESAEPAYAEEQTILMHEWGEPAPGWASTASGRVHEDRHWIIPIGRESESALILQRGGNTWRTLRNGPFALISGTLLLLVPLAILAFWRAVGPATTDVPESGQRIERFTGWQRFVHWSTAITFIVLALTGLLIMFGKQLLIPLVGHAAFSWIAIISKYLHNVVGPLFILCSVVMFFAFLRENVFRRWDWQWIRKGGGLVTHEHVPAGYFNAGEKMWFWFGVVLLGLVMSITGLLLNFVNFGQTRYVLQLANLLHVGGATLYIAAAMGHIYIGTLGTPGAYHAMRHGTVDANWAHAHHRYWYDEVAGAPGRSAPPPPLAAPQPRLPGERA